MNHNQKIGKFGEILAKNYLIRHGYEILAENVKTSYQELDIIAKIKEKIVFVEVKTRTSDRFGLADDAISEKKLNNLKKSIAFYLSETQNETDNFQLDLIAIDIDKLSKKAKIKHYKEIF